MRYALVFSGQGLQHPEMLPWLAADQTVAALEASLGTGWREALRQPGQAASNRVAQRLLTATACAAWNQLRPLLPPPAIVAGYSVGELPAFAAAGVFDSATALRLADQRAHCMDLAVQGCATALLAVTGASADGLATLCQRCDLDVAIRIDTGSAILGGLINNIQPAEAHAQAMGWRCSRLNIALASHTRWMAPAVSGFAQALGATPLQAPTLPLLSNALGRRVRTAHEAGDALAQQLACTVRWDDCLRAIAAQRVDAVLEIGAGHALARMWTERHPQVPARSADEFRTAAGVVGWLRRAAPPA